MQPLTDAALITADGRGHGDVIALAAIRKCRVRVWIRNPDNRVGKVSANTQRCLAAIEDERDDQVFLVAEVARELADQLSARRHI